MFYYAVPGIKIKLYLPPGKTGFELRRKSGGLHIIPLLGIKFFYKMRIIRLGNDGLANSLHIVYLIKSAVQRNF